MLTTLTTVLGLAPLLYEQSQQAQFLKPTVITLVYGLGFGMVLVLLVVPALMAMQHDLGRQFAALRKALRMRRGGRRVGVATGLAGAAIAGLFAVTLGAVIVQGALPLHLLSYLPGDWAARVASLPEGLPALPLALGLFVAGSAVLVLAMFVLSVLLVTLLGLRNRRA